MATSPPSLLSRLESVPDDLAPARIATLGFGTILALLVVMLAWASLAHLPMMASAPARLVPSGRLQVVSHPRGGTLARVHVVAGERVAAGAPLVSLAAEAANAEVARSDLGAQVLDARILALEAELAGRSPAFPPDLAAASPAQVAAELALHRARQAERAADRQRAAAAHDAAVQALANAQAEAQARTIALRQAEQERQLMQSLVQRGLEPRIGLERAIAAQAQAEAAAGSATAGIRRAQAAVAETQAEAARLDSARRAESARALAAARAERAALAAGQPALRADRDRLTLRAPSAGIVNRVLVNTPGSAVPPGMPLVELLPVDQPLEVEARVSPRDIGFVREGQEARVRITAYDASAFGTARATVVRISPDAIAEPGGGISYEVRLRLDPSSLPRTGGKPLRLTAGMVADVGLLGPERSILSYIAGPFARLGDEAFRER